MKTQHHRRCFTYEENESLEGDSSVLEGRPSEALPVAGEHGGDGDADENFGPSNLNAA